MKHELPIAYDQRFGEMDGQCLSSKQEVILKLEQLVFVSVIQKHPLKKKKKTQFFFFQLQFSVVKLVTTFRKDIAEAQSSVWLKR